MAGIMQPFDIRSKGLVVASVVYAVAERHIIIIVEVHLSLLRIEGYDRAEAGLIHSIGDSCQYAHIVLGVFDADRPAAGSGTLVTVGGKSEHVGIMAGLAVGLHPFGVDTDVLDPAVIAAGIEPAGLPHIFDGHGNGHFLPEETDGRDGWSEGERGGIVGLGDGDLNLGGGVSRAVSVCI